MEYITDKDLLGIKEEDINFGPIGRIVDTRTYRRPKEEGGRETALEAFKRVINYNVKLASDRLPYTELREEALLMLDKMVQLKVLPSNRARWVAGTDVINKNSLCAFNCSTVPINRLKAFSQLFMALMLGAGVGFRVFYRDINQLPNLREDRKKVTVEYEEYKSLPKELRQENTSIEGKRVIIGDSKEGWVKAIEYLLEAFHKDEVNTIKYNFDSVRPYGERLKNFGGRASGPGALKNIIKAIHRIIEECPSQKLRSIDCMDISCAIASGVVAGSVRRSSLICLFDEGDELCANAKKGIFTDPSKFYKKYRVQSNNTECIGSHGWQILVDYVKNNPDCTYQDVKLIFDKYKPSKDMLQGRIDSLKSIGDPGFNNYLLMAWKRFEAARQYRPDEDFTKYMDVSTNPCSEILLSAGYEDGRGGSVCNLSTQCLPNFVTEGKLDLDELEVCTRLITRIGLRQTLVDLNWESWDITQKKERLLGVSITGWQDALQMFNWDTLSPQASDLRKTIRYWANDEADKYTKKLGVNRPLLVTCVKPEGTSSVVFGVSSGLHWSWAPYYIRRVRISSKDGLAKTLKAMGYTVYPELDNNNNSSISTAIGDYDLSYKLDEDNEEYKELYQSYLNLDSLPERFKLACKEICYNTSTFNRRDAKFKVEVFENMPIEAKEEGLNKCKTWVFSFPIKSQANYTAASIKAITQLENLRLFSVEYTDHLPSCTITVKDSEWEDCMTWIFDNWNKGFITTSLMPYYGGDYPLLPHEEIDKKTYDSMIDNLDSSCMTVNNRGEISFKVNYSLLTKYERQIDTEYESQVMDDTCKGGCPIR